MKNEKIGLGNVQGRLSRAEMKQVLGGLVEPGEPLPCNGKCSYLVSPNSNIFDEGDCENATGMNTGCVCKRKDGFTQPGCDKPSN